MKKVIILSLNLFWCYRISAQSEFFSELAVEKGFLNTEKWEINVEGNYKHAYQDSRWRRVGADFEATRKLSGSWALVGGLDNRYRFDSELGDFYELRPFKGLKLDSRIIQDLKLTQRFIVEWRNFFLNRHEHYFRSRFRIGLDYQPGKSEEKNHWIFASAFEWFFLRDPITEERYPDNRRFSLSIIRTLENETEIGIGYLREIFLLNSERFSTRGNIISVQLRF
jgi:hypothetical protein